MEERFQTYRWKFVCRKPKTCFLIYAREQKTAEEIIAVENTENLYFLKLAKVFSKKAVKVKVPPFELEQHQLEAAEARLERRRAYLKEHPEHRAWLAKH